MSIKLVISKYIVLTNFSYYNRNVSSNVFSVSMANGYL